MNDAKQVLIALHEVMSAVGYVQKKDKNEFHRYKYASEASLLAVLRPAMLKAGLLLIPSGKDVSDIDSFGNTHVVVEYTLAHTSGEVWPDKVIAYGCGNDKNSKGGVGDKGLYKALTGANKYLLFKLFQIETGDDPEVECAGDKGQQKEPDSTVTPEEVKAIFAGNDTGDPQLATAQEIDDLKATLKEFKLMGKWSTEKLVECGQPIMSKLTFVQLEWMRHQISLKVDQKEAVNGR